MSLDLRSRALAFVERTDEAIDIAERAVDAAEDDLRTRALASLGLACMPSDPDRAAAILRVRGPRAAGPRPRARGAALDGLA